MGVLSDNLLVAFILLTLLFRITIGQPFHSKVRQLLLQFFLPFFAGLSIILTFVDFFNTPNYVYSKFFINYDQVGLLAITLGIILILTTSDKFYKKHVSSILFYGAPIMLFVLFIMWFWPQSFFLRITGEDQFIENAQFIVLLLGAIISGYISYLYKRRDKTKAIVFFIFAAVLLLIAGDEISWSQRLFSITTPEFIGNQNTQNEITIHNNYRVDGLVKWGYMLVGFYGAYAWLLFRYFPKFQKIPSMFVPYWFTMWFFFAGFIYNFYTLLPGHSFGEWSEVAELMLYLGITLHVTTVYFLLKKEKLFSTLK